MPHNLLTDAAAFSSRVVSRDNTLPRASRRYPYPDRSLISRSLRLSGDTLALATQRLHDSTTCLLAQFWTVPTTKGRVAVPRFQFVHVDHFAGYAS